MVNKQGLWFLTLFSLILVLSVYYITMPNELLLSNNNSYVNELASGNDSNKTNITVKEIDENLTALRVSLESEREILVESLQMKLVDSELTANEKNMIYEELKYINKVRTTEESLEKKLKESKNLDSFVKINKDSVEVTISLKEHSSSLAIEVMELIQEEFEEKMYISVRFNS